MGYDLKNRSNYFRFNIHIYPKVLELSLAYNWIPKGTILNPMEGNNSRDWNGSYDSNDGQYVIPEDSINLAEALGIAILLNSSSI